MFEHVRNAFETCPRLVRDECEMHSRHVQGVSGTNAVTHDKAACRISLTATPFLLRPRRERDAFETRAGCIRDVCRMRSRRISDAFERYLGPELYRSLEFQMNP